MREGLPILGSQKAHWPLLWGFWGLDLLRVWDRKKDSEVIVELGRGGPRERSCQGPRSGHMWKPVSAHPSGPALLWPAHPVTLTDPPVCAAARGGSASQQPLWGPWKALQCGRRPEQRTEAKVNMAQNLVHWSSWTWWAAVAALCHHHQVTRKTFSHPCGKSCTPRARPGVL